MTENLEGKFRNEMGFRGFWNRDETRFEKAISGFSYISLFVTDFQIPGLNSEIVAYEEKKIAVSYECCCRNRKREVSQSKIFAE